jgi:predicted nuclease of restriction endonuclease-like (RecB) superfamily
MGQDLIESLPSGYQELLEDIKRRIAEARTRASLAVNRKLIELYWWIGSLIVYRQQEEGWGSAAIERLSQDLRAAFPGATGLSKSNIWRMRAFYLAYHASEELAQPARDSRENALPQAVAEIPWGHNIALIEKVKDRQQRLWYAAQTIEHGWSRAVLVHQIESDLYSRQGQALTNFEHALPVPQSDLARELVKDPYHLDFLGLADDISERELERSLLDHLKEFLLELGKGFAFMGSQYHMEVGGQDYFLDLLFYNTILRAYVVIDLKVEAFKPEFAGKMNFYLNAVEDQLRHPEDQPPIGLILCKERNHVTVEFSLRGMDQPMGVSEYRLLPREIQATLPSPEEWEAELESVEGEGQS